MPVTKMYALALVITLTLINGKMLQLRSHGGQLTAAVPQKFSSKPTRIVKYNNMEFSKKRGIPVVQCLDMDTDPDEDDPCESFAPGIGALGLCDKVTKTCKVDWPDAVKKYANGIDRPAAFCAKGNEECGWEEPETGLTFWNLDSHVVGLAATNLEKSSRSSRVNSHTMLDEEARTNTASFVDRTFNLINHGQLNQISIRGKDSEVSPEDFPKDFTTLIKSWNVARALKDDSADVKEETGHKHNMLSPQLWGAKMPWQSLANFGIGHSDVAKQLRLSYGETATPRTWNSDGTTVTIEPYEYTDSSRTMLAKDKSKKTDVDLAALVKKIAPKPETHALLVAGLHKTCDDMNKNKLAIVRAYRQLRLNGVLHENITIVAPWDGVDFQPLDAHLFATHLLGGGNGGKTSLTKLETNFYPTEATVTSLLAGDTVKCGKTSPKKQKKDPCKANDESKNWCRKPRVKPGGKDAFLFVMLIDHGGYSRPEKLENVYDIATRTTSDTISLPEGRLSLNNEGDKLHDRDLSKALVFGLDKTYKKAAVIVASCHASAMLFSSLSDYSKMLRKKISGGTDGAALLPEDRAFVDMGQPVTTAAYNRRDDRTAVISAYA